LRSSAVIVIVLLGAVGCVSSVVAAPFVVSKLVSLARVTLAPPFVFHGPLRLFGPAQDIDDNDE
jgi:hypothetical protein